MSNSGQSSSHPRGEPQPVNPYAASRQPLPLESFAKQPVGGEQSYRTYQTRMTWKDRRNFLKSVGLIRVVAICFALPWLNGIYENTREWYLWLANEPAFDWIVNATLGFALISLLGDLFAVYLCYIAWKYADSILDVAGGSTVSMADWSRVHQRAAVVAAAAGILGFIGFMGRWLIDQALAQWLFPV